MSVANQFKKLIPKRETIMSYLNAIIENRLFL